MIILYISEHRDCEKITFVARGVELLFFHMKGKYCDPFRIESLLIIRETDARSICLIRHERSSSKLSKNTYWYYYIIILGDIPYYASEMENNVTLR